MSEIDIIKVLS